MKLELGKRYVRRDGTVTGPLVRNNMTDVYPFYKEEAPEYRRTLVRTGKDSRGSAEHKVATDGRSKEATEPSTEEEAK